MRERPEPINRQKNFGENEFIVSKTDLKGRITYGNALFIDISGYAESELLGAPHNILRHPDMPRVVFKLLWDRIDAQREIFAYVKNLAKDGSYYWVLAQVTPSLDDQGQSIGYHSVRRRPKEAALNAIEPLYARLLSVEKQQGLEASEAALMAILDEKGVSYDAFIHAL
jgi:PAS domain S-box-containing protein